MFRIARSPSSFLGKEELETTYGERKAIKQINQYLLTCVLGEGSFAKVFLGLDTNTFQKYAMKRIHLKELARTSSGISQLEREIDTMRMLHHPNIVGLKEVIHVPDKSVAFLAIDYADCGNISSILEKGYRFSYKETRALFKQIAEGIGFLHGNGIVHQDIKPANILLKSDGTALISDFGIGHSFQSAAQVVGTPAYQAPEVIDECSDIEDEEEDEEKGKGNEEEDDDDADDPGKEDVWSLGVSLYEMSFNELPFYGANVFEIVRSIATTTLEMPEGADPVLWDLITNMLKVNPRKRYTIEKVLAHDYVTGANVADSPHLKPMEEEAYDHSLPIQKIVGTVCEEGYSFALHDKAMKKKKKRPPFPFPRLPQFNP